MVGDLYARTRRAPARRPLLFWPLASPFLALLLAAVVLLVLLLQLDVVTYAIHRLGLDPTSVSVILLATLFGGAVNLPLFRVRSERVLVQSRVVRFWGVRYFVPGVRVQQRTVVAANVGGALVPVGVSAYLFFHDQLGAAALVATGVVAIIARLVARPVPGVGVVLPGLVAPVVAAVAALVLGGGEAPAVAYVAGVTGTLIGADLLNLHRVARFGSPVVSIGGAGTFDGIVLSGIIAVLIASFVSG